MLSSILYYSGEPGEVDPAIQDKFDHHTKRVTIDSWMEAILNVSPEKIRNYSACFTYEQLLHPSTSIMKNLQNYCRPSEHEGTEHHIAWSAIVNEIISQSSKLIPDLPPLPLPPVFLQHGTGHRIPDVVIVPKSISSDTVETGKQDHDLSTDFDCWSKVLGCVEFTSEWYVRLEGISAALVARLEDDGGKPGRLAEAPSEPPSDAIPSAIVDVSQTPSESTNSRKRKRSSTSLSGPSFKRIKTGFENTETPTTDSQQEAAGRLFRYALKFMKRNSGTRAHSLQFLVDRSRLMLWYYDAGGIIHSEWMDWIDDLPKFAAIITAFASLDIRGWGIGNVPILRPPPDLDTLTGPLPRSLSGYTLTMTHRSLEGISQQVKVTLQGRVFTSQSLVGRRTHVYDIITEPEISKKPLVLKMSMQMIDRTPEYEYIERATSSGVDHVPEMHLWSNRDEEWRLSDGVWGRLFPDNEDHKVYEDRCQRLIVFTKYEPVESIISPANMHNLVMQLVDCIHELRYKALVLHRDISLGNLMYEQLGDSIKLILNDFDHAAMVHDDGLPVVANTSKHQSGTLPFMAYELLNPREADSITHYLRHDLESVFLVAIWVTIKFGLRANDVESQQEGRDILYGWEHGTLEDIYAKKKTMIKEEETISDIVKTVDMGAYKGWVFGFWWVFWMAYKTRAELRVLLDPVSDLELPEGPHEVTVADMETLDGLISRDRIQQVLRRWEVRCTQQQDIEGFVSYFGQTTS